MTTLNLDEAAVWAVLEQLLAERIVTSFGGGEGRAHAFQLVETWKAQRGKPKSRGKKAEAARLAREAAE